MALKEGISGPHLAAAFLCERVLVERDGVSTFVRVVDRFNIPVLPKLPPSIQLPPGVQLPNMPSPVQFQLVIILKSGDLGGGKFNMKVVIRKPDGSELPSQAFSIFFNGGEDNGVAVVSPMVIPNPDEGLHWFDVYFEEMLLTRIPMRIFYQQIQFQIPPAPSS